MVKVQPFDLLRINFRQELADSSEVAHLAFGSCPSTMASLSPRSNDWRRINLFNAGKGTMSRELFGRYNNKVRLSPPASEATRSIPIV